MEQLQAVLNHKPDTESRICRRLEVGRAIHQGDVYVFAVAGSHPRGDRLGTRQVAVGTTIGSRHVADGDGVEVFAAVAGAADKLLPLFDADQRAACLGPVVVARDTWTLTHPEHAHHVMPAGTFQVVYQWDEATRRNVAD